MLSLPILLSNCKKDTINLPGEEPAQLAAMAEGVKLAASGITSSSYYLVNSLPAGYVKDGTKDYTSYVQAAVTKYSNIVFPGFPIQVNDTGITIGSNKTITFESGGKILLKPSSKAGYQIFRINGVTNVTLYNPVLVGDRAKHIGTSGEWGNGISMNASSNITIYNANITDCWGDGMYIGQGSSISKNITIKDPYLRNNRRAGISIIAVDGLLLDNLYAGYNAGTVPATGINFEPNKATSELKNIVLNNPVTEKNGERAIQFVGHAMLSSSTSKTIDVTIVNHIDKSSPMSSFKFSVNNTTTSAKMTGTIKIVNPSWQRTLNNRPLHILTNQLGVKISVTSPEVINSTGSTLSWSSMYSLLTKAGSNVTVTQ